MTKGVVTDQSYISQSRALGLLNLGMRVVLSIRAITGIGRVLKIFFCILINHVSPSINFKSLRAKDAECLTPVLTGHLSR